MPDSLPSGTPTSEPANPPDWLRVVADAVVRAVESPTGLAFARWLALVIAIGVAAGLVLALVLLLRA